MVQFLTRKFAIDQLNMSNMHWQLGQNIEGWIIIVSKQRQKMTLITCRALMIDKIKRIIHL